MRNVEVAQLVEQVIVNHSVDGSNPSFNATLGQIGSYSDYYEFTLHVGHMMTAGKDRHYLHRVHFFHMAIVSF